MSEKYFYREIPQKNGQPIKNSLENDSIRSLLPDVSFGSPIQVRLNKIK